MRNYYTPKEVAKKLKVRRKTVYRWLNAGKIEYEQTIGGRYRIPKSQIDNALQ